MYDVSLFSTYQPSSQGWQKLELKIEKEEKAEKVVERFWQASASTLLSLLFLVFLNENKQVPLILEREPQLGEMQMASGKSLEKLTTIKGVRYFAVQLIESKEENDKL